jgi:hypothetical protein
MSFSASPVAIDDVGIVGPAFPRSVAAVCGINLAPATT